MPKPVITFVFKVLRNTDCFGTYVTHAQTCDYVRVQSATEWTASVHTLHMPKPVITEWTASVHTLHMPNSCSKCYGTDCFGTYVTHAQTCDYVRVQSATEWTASVHTLHMPKPKCYGMDCFGTYVPVITFVFKVLRNGLLRYILAHAQTCDYVRVQSATERTASVHTQTCDYVHMPKPVITRSCSKCYGTDCFGTYFTHAQTCATFVFKVLRNGLLRYILYTCPNL